MLHIFEYGYLYANIHNSFSQLFKPLFKWLEFEKPADIGLTEINYFSNHKECCLWRIRCFFSQINLQILSDEKSHLVISCLTFCINKQKGTVRCASSCGAKNW